MICVHSHPRETESVFAELVADAERRRLAALCGRLEPHLDAPLRRRYAVLGFGQMPIVHARDPEILAALSAPESILTELDLIDTPWW